MRTSLTLFVVSCVSFLTLPAAAGVLQRARLGHGLEDITLVRSAPFLPKAADGASSARSAGIASLDGYEVYLSQLDTKEPPRKLFDLRDVESPGHSQGLAWIESEQVFAITSAQEPGLLRIVDADGRLVGTRPVAWPAGRTFVGTEGLSYIPRHAALYPDHLAIAVNFASGEGARIAILDLAGNVVHEIVPEPDINDAYILGLAFQPPARLLVSVLGFSQPDNHIWTLDLDGTTVAGPTPLTELNAIEGITVLDDGRVVAREFFADRIQVYAPGLDLLLGGIDHHLGVGLGNLQGVAWDPNQERHVVLAGTPATQHVVYRVSPGLTTSAFAGFPSANNARPPRRVAFMPDENRIAVATQNVPRAIVLLNPSGAIAEEIDVSALGSPTTVEYIEPTRQFAIRTLEGGGLTLYIVARDGSLDRTLDLTATGVSGIGAIAYFNPGHPSGGEFLIAGITDAVEIDFNGNLLRSVDLAATLDIRRAFDLASITSGPQAGAFSVVDSFNAELVVFTLD